MTSQCQDNEQSPHFISIDHIAIAVHDLESAIEFYCFRLGFKLNRRRAVKGTTTGMICAELEHNGIRFVLCQGTEETSQVSKLVSQYGPGVAHVAFSVSDVDAVASALEARGIEFDTSVIVGPGLTQTFTSRDPNSGLSFELIKRSGNDEFSEASIQELFDQLERSGKY